MRKRRAIGFLAFLLGIAGLIATNLPEPVESSQADEPIAESTLGNAPLAVEKLQQIEIKGRAPKTGYSREQFGNGWGKINGCDARNVILFRDLKDVVLKDECLVATGTLNDPYTGNSIDFDRTKNASAVQIDHVVALSDAWQKGAQSWEKDKRVAFANDPLNLIASDGPANQQKGDSDAASWLPSNKAFRCEYVARQISVKIKYGLWNTEAETDAMHKILQTCPSEPILE